MMVQDNCITELEHDERKTLNRTKGKEWRRKEADFKRREICWKMEKEELRWRGVNSKKGRMLQKNYTICGLKFEDFETPQFALQRSGLFWLLLPRLLGAAPCTDLPSGKSRSPSIFFILFFGKQDFIGQKNRIKKLLNWKVPVPTRGAVPVVPSCHVVSKTKNCWPPF